MRCLTRNAPYSLTMTAESATLKLDNQKNGWKGVCVHQEANGEAFNCPVKALAPRVIHLRKNGRNDKTLLSAFYPDGIRYDVTREDISKGLKMAAMLLHYPEMRGIPIECIDTHSLQSGGANALALSGYSDIQIQKMGRWKGVTFKEYITEGLTCYSAGMSSNMKGSFKFVNVSPATPTTMSRPGALRRITMSIQWWPLRPKGTLHYFLFVHTHSE